VSSRPIDHINKVTHQSIVKEPVIQVPAHTGSEKAKGDMNQPLFRTAEKKNRQDYEQRNDGNGDEQQTPAGSYPECGPGIFSHHEPQQTVYYGDTLVRGIFEPAEYDALGTQVGRQTRCRKRPEKDMRRARRQFISSIAASLPTCIRPRSIFFCPFCHP